jgi:predicted nucleic acid-binding Zn ribbon protein
MHVLADICGMSSRKYTDQPLRTIIGELLKNSGLEKRYNELEVAAAYRSVIGEVIWKKTRDVRVHGKTLVLKMDSGSLKQELSFQKSKIVSLVNEKLGAAWIENLEVW